MAYLREFIFPQYQKQKTGWTSWKGKHYITVKVNVNTPEYGRWAGMWDIHEIEMVSWILMLVPWGLLLIISSTRKYVLPPAPERQVLTRSPENRISLCFYIIKSLLSEKLKLLSRKFNFFSFTWESFNFKHLRRNLK